VLSHSTDEFAYDKMHQVSAEAKERSAIWIPRSKDDILPMFSGRALIDPGLVLVSHWWPDDGIPDPTRTGPGLTAASLRCAEWRAHIPPASSRDRLVEGE
jgi:S-adenosyl methyltransferase